MNDMTLPQRDAQVMRLSRSAQRRTLASALADIRWFECTLMRDPDGGWWVAPDGGGAYADSMTRHCADLDDAVSAADQIDRRRTNRW